MTRPGIVVRALGADDDLDGFGRIVLASYHALDGRPFDPGYDVELVDVARRVEAATVLGAFAGARPVGCITYVGDASSPMAEHLGDGEASFRMLAVDVAAQGQGVGEALVIACIDRASAGGRALFIHSGTWMTAAHRLYGRLGFARVPERDWEIVDGGFTLLAFHRPAPGAMSREPHGSAHNSSRRTRPQRR